MYIFFKILFLSSRQLSTRKMTRSLCRNSYHSAAEANAKSFSQHPDPILLRDLTFQRCITGTCILNRYTFNQSQYVILNHFI